MVWSSWAYREVRDGNEDKSMSAPVPILIVIPFWKGDLNQAFDLCRIVAGLQANHVGSVAHVMLVCRQDCRIDPNMVKIISAKFNTHTYHSMSPLKGWPSGANGIFGSTMLYISNNMRDKYECVYWMEPDAIPTKPNWFWDLVLAWRGRHTSTWIVGCRSDCNGDGTGDHITGCALYHPNIARLLPEIIRSDRVAWDYEHRAKIVRVGGHTKLIQNRYHQRNVDPGVINEPGVVIIHGVKDRSLVNVVSKKYKIPLQ